MKLTLTERRERMESAYRKLIENGSFLEMLALRTAGSYNRFSLGNIMDIMFQAAMLKEPLPPVLLPFGKARQLGHPVKKDQHARYFVIAPTYGRQYEDEDGHKQRRLVGFHGVAEFTVDQLHEGEELLAAQPEPDKGDDSDAQLVALVEWSPWLIYFEGMRDSTGGYYDPELDIIGINTEHTSREQLRTLVHELIHARGANHRNNTHSYAENEMITELAAAIVLLGLGYENVDYSASYVASWAKLEPLKGVAMLDEAQRYAKELEDVLDPISDDLHASPLPDRTSGNSSSAPTESEVA